MNKKPDTRSVLYILLIITSLGYGCAPVQKVPVLMYHEITDNTTPGDQTRISLQRFEEQMDWLAENHYNSLTLDELLAFMKGASIPEKSFVLTIDDGWKSQLQMLPALKRHGFKATFFVFPGAGIEDPYGDYLSWAELKDISNDPDFEVQAHSMTHPWDRDSNLVTWVAGRPEGKSRTDAEYELKQSRQILEQRLGVAVKHFAWPAGYFNDTLIHTWRQKPAIRPCTPSRRVSLARAVTRLEFHEYLLMELVSWRVSDNHYASSGKFLANKTAWPEKLRVKHSA